MSTNTTLGLTGNFLSNMILISRCVAEYGIFDDCIDATEYVPTGETVGQSGVAISNVTFSR